MSSGSFPAPRSIVVVVVLYKRAPHQSQSLSSLVRILQRHPDLARELSLILFDNSPERHDVELALDCPMIYKHDSSNPGLATAYNFALNLAHERQHEWLLLLDQDTSLSDAFLIELKQCTTTLASESRVASIVPKLVVDGTIHSPAAHFIDQIRHQYKFRRSGPGVSEDLWGMQRGRLSAYNSGSTFRVDALRSIGGFPPEFWLDYLDHAVFHGLDAHGYKMYVLHASIGHEASQANVRAVPVWRQRNILAAQTLFVSKTATFWERALYRIWLLRYSRSLYIQRADKRLWKEALVQALRPQWPSAYTIQSPFHIDQGKT